MNQDIIKIRRRHTIALIIILVMQALPMFFMSQALYSFVFYVFGLIILVVDLYFAYKKIFLLNRLIDVAPRHCVIEDFLLIGHRANGSTTHSVYPIVRSISDQKLYLAHGENALRNFNTIQTHSGRSLVDIHVISNGKELYIGDYVNMYVLKTLDVDVNIDGAKNQLIIGKSKNFFKHVNKDFTIDKLRDVVLFKGVVC